MATVITVKVDGEAVDVISARVNFRTINQGHSMFSAMVDNYSGGYDGVFDANDSIEISISGVVVFSGALDSVRHIEEQDTKWDFMDYIRLAGRDLSYELSNFKYTRTFPSGMQIDEMINEAIPSGCNITMVSGETPLIDGHTSIDQSLLDLIIQVFEKAEYEGYVDLAGELQAFEVDDESKSTGITLSKSNILGKQHVEVGGMDIKNSITVLGALNLWEPEETPDLWTEADLSGWEQIVGSGLRLWDSARIGSNSVIIEPSADDEFEVTFTPYDDEGNPIKLRIGYYGQLQYLQFWGKGELDVTHKMCLHTDEDNYFETDLFDLFEFAWNFFEFPLGTSQVNTEKNPEGIWTSHGDPDWLNINYIRWYGSTLGTAWRFQAIDDLAFREKRTHGFAESPGSIGSYGKRELVRVTNAATNKECQKTANDHIAKLANPVDILSITVPLETLIVGGVWKGLPGYRIGVSEVVNE